MPCPSFEASFDPAHHHHQRQRAYYAWINLPNAADSDLARSQKNKLHIQYKKEIGMPTQEFVEGVTLIFIHTTKYMSNTEIYVVRPVHVSR
jgi:hypothetical protein